jgi:hypothetical protein
MKFTILSFALLSGVGLTLLFPLKSKAKVRQQQETVELIEEDTLITLIAVGDMMLGTNFPSSKYLPPRDLLLLEPMHGILKNGDIVFGNLEGTVLNEGGKVKKCSDSTKCYAFRQPEYFVPQIKAAGFHFLSLANNHLGDFGDEGRENTQRVLREAGFRFAGLESCPWDTMTVKGVKVGMTAFAPNTGCLRITDYDLLRSVVQHLDSICDIVIVSFHGGAEGSSRTHVTRKKEIFYEEDRGNVYEFARIAIDAGADVLLGHGPHVTRAIDHYKGRFITYSMGNFCTYGRFNLSGVSGIAPVFELKLTRNGEFVSGRVISTKQVGEGGPQLDPTNGALEQVKSLTKSDFPELQVLYGKNGVFSFPVTTR